MIEQMRIGMMSGGDPIAYDRYLAVLKAQERAGEIRILDIEDGVATIELLDERLIRLASSFAGCLQ